MGTGRCVVLFRMGGIDLGDDMVIENNNVWYLEITLEDEAMASLDKMVQESGMDIADLAEIAVYNLIALWQRDKGVGIQPMDSHDGVDFVDKFHLP